MKERGAAKTPGRDLAALAADLAPREGYNSQPLRGVRILRSETDLRDVPVLYQPGAVFVCQGSKRGALDGAVYLYDEEHYLAVSVPVPFRMESRASPETPLLAVYLDFDMQVVADIVGEIERKGPSRPACRAAPLVSSRMEPVVAEALRGLLTVLRDPVETAVLGEGLLRALHYRVLTGPQGGAMIEASRQRGTTGRVLGSLRYLRDRYATGLTVAELAGRAGMSVPSYHAHFRALLGSSPIRYLKSMRLHEARRLLARGDRTVAEVALMVGYASPSQFSREFKRHFGRTAREEVQWMRRHMGELS